MFKIAGKIFVDADEWSARLNENIRLQHQVNRLTKELEDSRNYDFWKDSLYSVFHGMYQQLFKLSVDTYEKMNQEKESPSMNLSTLTRFYKKATKAIAQPYG